MPDRDYFPTRDAECGCRELEHRLTRAIRRYNCRDHPYGEGSPLNASVVSDTDSKGGWTS